jgi:hypothetical protein
MTDSTDREIDLIENASSKTSNLTCGKKLGLVEEESAKQNEEMKNSMALR